MASAHLLNLASFSKLEIEKLFSLAERLAKESSGELPSQKQKRGRYVALVFFEPSTRTRLSFEAACHRSQMAPLVIHGTHGTSLEKGETYQDTVLNIAAMDPALVVIRAGDQFDMQTMTQQLKIPVVNAGWGKKGHPTQALLDLFCLWRKGRDLSKEKIFICGDIRHSRVVASHLELAKTMGLQVAFGGPEELLPPATEGHQRFATLDEGMRWATVVMGLRVQLERHESSLSLAAYHHQWRISKSHLDQHKNLLLMHPGPVNWGTELAEDVTSHPSSCILDQVNAGVFLRQAVLEQLLGGA